MIAKATQWMRSPRPTLTNVAATVGRESVEDADTVQEMTGQMLQDDRERPDNNKKTQESEDVDDMRTKVDDKEGPCQNGWRQQGTQDPSCDGSRASTLKKSTRRRSRRAHPRHFVK